MSEPTRYAAFLSYSHRDKRWADWLHRALETYRPPARLDPGANLREALRPIFRDRDELPASPDLSRQINEALAGSRALIVLCSPAAAKSQWTNAEIATFKRLHPDRPVLAVIVAGEPYASAIPGREDEEAFPPALRFQVAADGSLTDVRAEPIAADLRADADGKRMGKLKVVAGLLDVGLDRLVQRETARRNRRFALFAGASLAGMALTSGLALFAFRQRAEAVHQRVQADGLIEFMLTDLRSKLEPVGRLDALDSVGEKALRYYAAQDLASLDADSLGRRARALQLVGEVANTRGNLGRAMPLFEQAAATTDEQLRRDPDNPQRIFDHAQSVYWVGYVAWERGDTASARRLFSLYRDYAERLSAVAGGNVTWEAELGYANTNLGVVELGDEHPDVALRRFEAAYTVWSRIRTQQPSDRQYGYLLAQELAWEADARRKLADYRGALADRRQEIGAYQALLLSDAGDSKANEGLSVAWLRSAQLALEAGQPKEAITLTGQSLQNIRKLEAEDPTNRLWKEMDVKSANMRVEALMMRGEWPAARLENTLALKHARELVTTNDSIASWRSECLMPARWMEIAIARNLGPRGVADAYIDRFKRDYPASGKLENDDERFARAIVFALSGIDRLALAKAPQAHDDFTRVVRLLGSASGPMDGRESALLRIVYDQDPQIGSTAQPLTSQIGSKYDLRAILFGKVRAQDLRRSL